jgi:Asp-tRNA(Asn)/Glu-tRNA(Gln) amidotransferase C subunit
VATTTRHEMSKTAEDATRNAQHTARAIMDYVGRVGEINTEIAERTAEVWVEGLRKQTELSKRMTQEFAEKTVEQVYGSEGSFATGFPGWWAPYYYDPFGLWRTWAQALWETYEEAASDAQQTAVLTAQQTARDAQRRAAEETARVVETTAPRNGGFPIADYDEKTVEEITDRLDTLADEQLRRVKDYEKRTKNRETLVQQIDRRIMRSS